MNKVNFHSNQLIPTPSWDNVRGIYRKLSEEFDTLTDSFKIKVSPETKLNLDHLIIVIDDVDKCVDELPEKASRDSITSSLISFLENDDENWHHEHASALMVKQIEIIKVIILKEGIAKEFIDAAKTIFYATETKRYSTDLDELIDLIQQEGMATSLLPLSILKIDPEHTFGVFFGRLCRIMGIADLVFDAREDYKLGYIKFKPSLKLYYRLNKIVLVEGLKLIWSFPKKLKFFVYCIKFTIALMKE